MAAMLNANTRSEVWSLVKYTDTSEQAVDYGAQNMVTVQFGFPISDLPITGPV
jgi:hypothetical protein